MEGTVDADEGGSPGGCVKSAKDCEASGADGVNGVELGGRGGNSTSDEPLGCKALGAVGINGVGLEGGRGGSSTTDEPLGCVEAGTDGSEGEEFTSFPFLQHI